MAHLLYNRSNLAQFFFIRGVECSEDGSRNLCVSLLPVVVLLITNVDMVLFFLSSVLSFLRKSNPSDSSGEQERPLSSSWHSGSWCKLLCLIVYVELWCL